MVDESSESRYATARTLCYFAAFVTGGLGATLLIRPVDVNVMIPVVDLPRWWGLLGVGVAVLLVYWGRGLGEIELPEDFEQQRDDARVEENWMEVYRLTRHEAAYRRQEDELEREREAREELVELACDRLDHGEYQALRQLQRLRALDPDEVGYVERRIEILRRIGSVERLGYALEDRLGYPFDDEEAELEVRHEIVELADPEGEAHRRLEHAEWILARSTDADFLEEVVGWADEEAGEGAAEVVRVIERAAESTSEGEWRERLEETAETIEIGAGDGE